MECAGSTCSHKLVRPGVSDCGLNFLMRLKPCLRQGSAGALIPYNMAILLLAAAPRGPRSQATVSSPGDGQSVNPSLGLCIRALPCYIPRLATHSAATYMVLNRISAQFAPVRLVSGWVSPGTPALAPCQFTSTM